MTYKNGGKVWHFEPFGFSTLHLLRNLGFDLCRGGFSVDKLHSVLFWCNP